MRKLILLLCCTTTLYSMAQQKKPTTVTKVNNNFITSFNTYVKGLKPSAIAKLKGNDKALGDYLLTLKNVDKWQLADYKTFAKQITPLIKNIGIKADPDDGGEVFADPDDGGEVVASARLIANTFAKWCMPCGCVCPIKW
jgi:hypothetical protein